MTVTEIAVLLIGAYASGWVSGFLILSIKRFMEMI